MSAHITLTHPVEADGRAIASLTMRRPKVRDERDARRVASDDEEREIALFANLCQVAPETIHEMDLDDYRNLQKAFMGFSRADGQAPKPSDGPPPK